MGLRCLHASIFIETPSLEGLPTKAKKDIPLPMRWDYAPLDINPVFSVLGEIIIVVVIIIIIIIIINTVIPHTRNKLKGETIFGEIELLIQSLLEKLPTQ